MAEELRFSVRAARVFGVCNLVAAAVAAFGVFGALPARWWVVDSGAVIVSALLAASGAGLLARTAWSERAARLAAIVVLAIGLALVALLAVTVAYLRGIYGPVGRGGAIILALVAAIALPYLVVLPAALLVYLGPARSR